MDNRVRYLYILYNPMGMQLSQHRDCSRVKRHAAMHISSQKETIYIARYDKDDNIHSYTTLDEAWRQEWLHNSRNIIEWDSDVPSFIPRTYVVKS